MTMDSNEGENLIGMMIISSNSSSSGSSGRYDGADAAAEEKKRRFSEAQVRSLEMMFETQAKLEPRKKQQLAKELGLQPRQVAIWFQNKRARWKSKQLERAYAALRADYDALHSSFDSLLLQKNALSLQVQRLAEMLGTKPQENSKEEEGEEHCKQRNCSEADKITPVLSLSSNANNSDEEEKKLNAPLDEDEVARRRQTAKGGSSSSLVSEDIEHQQFCFNAMGWAPSDPLMMPGGGGCSQWWEFLSYE